MRFYVAVLLATVLAVLDAAPYRQRYFDRRPSSYYPSAYYGAGAGYDVNDYYGYSPYYGSGASGYPYPYYNNPYNRHPSPYYPSAFPGAFPGRFTYPGYSSLRLGAPQVAKKPQDLLAAAVVGEKLQGQQPVVVYLDRDEADQEVHPEDAPFDLNKFIEKMVQQSDNQYVNDVPPQLQEQASQDGFFGGVAQAQFEPSAQEPDFIQPELSPVVVPVAPADVKIPVVEKINEKPAPMAADEPVQEIVKPIAAVAEAAPVAAQSDAVDNKPVKENESVMVDAVKVAHDSAVEPVKIAQSDEKVESGVDKVQEPVQDLVKEPIAEAEKPVRVDEPVKIAEPVRDEQSIVAPESIQKPSVEEIAQDAVQQPVVESEKPVQELVNEAPANDEPVKVVQLISAQPNQPEANVEFIPVADSSSDEAKSAVEIDGVRAGLPLVDLVPNALAEPQSVADTAFPQPIEPENVVGPVEVQSEQKPLEDVVPVVAALPIAVAEPVVIAEPVAVVQDSAIVGQEQKPVVGSQQEIWIEVQPPVKQIPFVDQKLTLKFQPQYQKPEVWIESDPAPAVSQKVVDSVKNQPQSDNNSKEDNSKENQTDRPLESANNSAEDNSAERIKVNVPVAPPVPAAVQPGVQADQQELVQPVKLADNSKEDNSKEDQTDRPVESANNSAEDNSAEKIKVNVPVAPLGVVLSVPAAAQPGVQADQQELVQPVKLADNSKEDNSKEDNKTDRPLELANNSAEDNSAEKVKVVAPVAPLNYPAPEPAAVQLAAQADQQELIQPVKLADNSKEDNSKEDKTDRPLELANNSAEDNSAEKIKVSVPVAPLSDVAPVPAAVQPAVQADQQELVQPVKLADNSKENNSKEDQTDSPLESSVDSAEDNSAERVKVNVPVAPLSVPAPVPAAVQPMAQADNQQEQIELVQSAAPVAAPQSDSQLISSEQKPAQAQEQPLIYNEEIVVSSGSLAIGQPQSQPLKPAAIIAIPDRVQANDEPIQIQAAQIDQKVEKPVAEDLKIASPVADEVKVEKPVADEAKVEKPAADEESKAAEPVAAVEPVSNAESSKDVEKSSDCKVEYIVVNEPVAEEEKPAAVEEAKPSSARFESRVNSRTKSKFGLPDMPY